jgi:hypothetical protein
VSVHRQRLGAGFHLSMRTGGTIAGLVQSISPVLSRRRKMALPVSYI